tara:strand:- start:1017 stop:1544 length:528 start_codon:yes stop_codon:yes gene_type:complete
MGLDMVAGWADPQPKAEGNVVPIKEESLEFNSEFDWRKHSRLHNLMQTIWFCKKFEGTPVPADEKGVRVTIKGNKLYVPEDQEDRAFLYRGLTSAIGTVLPEFNCENVQLDVTDIQIIRDLVEKGELPFCADGMFWGHQFQEDAMKQYKEQDLKFCDQALKWLEEGKEVYYSSWW